MFISDVDDKSGSWHRSAGIVVGRNSLEVSMSKTAKWIIGIFIGLVVLCAVVALGFLALSPMRGTALVIGGHMPRLWEGGRPNPGNDMPWDNMPMRPNRVLRGFLPFGGLFRGLFCLGFLFLIGLGIAALVLAITQTRKSPAAVAAPAAAAPPAQAAQAAIPAPTCPNCQRPVDEGWSHCPYCGTALTTPE
jgi:hypothetical protein